MISGLVELPYKFRISGIAEYRSGRPYNLTDASADFANCGFTSLGFNCRDARPVIGGAVVARNTGENESVSRIDLRVSKAFAFGNRYEVEVFGEVFNLFDEQSFEVDTGFGGDDQRDPSSSEFGLADNRLEDIGQRQFQLGARFRF